MLKKWGSLVLALAMVVGMIPAIGFTAPQTVQAVSTNLVAMPSNNGLTNNTSYTIGVGTDAEVEVICDFRSATQSPTESIGTPKYVTVHNTGTYVSTANAYNTHRNTAKVSTDMTWHYTVDNVAIYQALADTRKGWHIGSVAKNPSPTNSNSNSIGIEMCVHNFPATETFDGEQWNDGTAILQWWENQFDQTMKNTAYLCLVLCKRWGLDWRTQIVTHYDALNYYPGGKDCPMQMRATYDPVTNTFTEAGSYVDGRDGYFWQMFWSYLETYASGGTNTDGGTTAEKLGTYRVTPSNGLNVRASASASATKLGALENNAVVDVTELSSNGWGKVTLDDGQVGWCNITTYGEYIGVDALGYDVNAEGVSYTYDTDGGVILRNTTATDGRVDFVLPRAIGTLTTPYMSWQVTPLTGNGYDFGVMQAGTDCLMMRDPTADAGLAATMTVTYTTAAQTAQVNLKAAWAPTEQGVIDQVRVYVAPRSSVKINYFYFAVNSGAVTDARYNLIVGDGKFEEILLDSETFAVSDTIVSAVSPQTTVESFLAGVFSDYTVTVYQGDKVLSGEAIVTTGCVVKLTSGDTQAAVYEIAVRGDINGDGVMSPLDAREILVSILNDENYDGAKADAANLDGSGWLTTTLVRRMLLEIAQAA